MLTIRLSRTGKHKAPQYRVVLQEKGRDPWAPAKEILGHYNPRKQPSEIVLKGERIEYWLSQGAQPSNTVHNLLVSEGIIKAEKQNAVSITKKRAGKLADAKAEAEAKAKEAEEAKKAEAAAAKEAEEAAKAEETPAEEPAPEAEAATEEAPAEAKEEQAPADETKTE